MNRATRTAVLLGWLTVFAVVGWITVDTLSGSPWLQAAIGVALGAGATDVCLQWTRDRGNE